MSEHNQIITDDNEIYYLNEFGVMDSTERVIKWKDLEALYQKGVEQGFLEDQLPQRQCEQCESWVTLDPLEENYICTDCNLVYSPFLDHWVEIS